MATSDIDSEAYFPSTTTSRKRKRQVKNKSTKKPCESVNAIRIKWEPVEDDADYGNGQMEETRSGIHLPVNVDGDDVNRATEGDEDAGDIVDDFDSDALPYLHCQRFRPTIEESAEWEASGVNIRRGKFSKAEESQILRNFRNYVRLYGGDYWNHFGTGVSERKGRRSEHKKKYFHQRLAHGLPDRLLYIVYMHARKICNPNHSTREDRKLYTTDEINQIIRMRIVEGASFIKIGEMLNRTPNSVHDRFRLTFNMVKEGEFTDVDFLKLIMCVADVHRSDSLTKARHLLWSDINWGTVSNMMEDRSVATCQTAWMKIIMPAAITISRAQLYFLCSLLRVYARDAAEVPWDELATAIGMPDQYLARFEFYRRKAKVFLREQIPVPTSLKKIASKMRKILATKKIKCFREFENGKESNICDIPGLDTRHNLSCD